LLARTCPLEKKSRGRSGTSFVEERTPRSTEGGNIGGGERGNIEGEVASALILCRKTRQFEGGRGRKLRKKEGKLATPGEEGGFGMSVQKRNFFLSINETEEAECCRPEEEVKVLEEKLAVERGKFMKMSCCLNWLQRFLIVRWDEGVVTKKANESQGHWKKVM